MAVLVHGVGKAGQRKPKAEQWRAAAGRQLGGSRARRCKPAYRSGHTATINASLDRHTADRHTADRWTRLAPTPIVTDQDTSHEPSSSVSLVLSLAQDRGPNADSTLMYLSGSVGSLIKPVATVSWLLGHMQTLEGLNDKAFAGVV